mmetsp:Transcript_7130/g.16311  ORF Transcript_7130/g.16311 Transcript_7130/m.16311 type:complete len:136 (+) Transcript_7130:154-561(+)
MGPIVWRAPTWRYMYSRSLFLLLVAVCIVDGARAEDLADNDKPGEAPGKAQAARKPKRNLSLVSNLLTDLGLSETQKAVLVGCVVALVLLTQAVNGGQSLKKTRSGLGPAGYSGRARSSGRVFRGEKQGDPGRSG